MMDGVAGTGVAPTMYAVRKPGEVSPHTREHHVGNGDTLYSSLDRAREVAYHPTDPSQDRNIVKVNDLDPDQLHTDETGSTPYDFHYAPDSSSGWESPEDTASTPASLVHDPQRYQRIKGDLGHGWTHQESMLPYTANGGFEYQDPDSGRNGRMYQMDSGAWRGEHDPLFGSRAGRNYSTYSDAADAIRQGTRPGPTMDHHALEVNNDFDGSGEGHVDWQPHPSGQGLTATTPHGDLHLTQDPDSGRWNWHAGPHGSQPGNEGIMHAPWPDRLNSSAAAGIRAITRTPFHGGLGDELGESWRPHPVSPGAYTQRLPSGNHAYVVRNNDGGYESGIQRDNGEGRPSTAMAYRDSPDLATAKEFIQHRENSIPASALGEGWMDRPLRNNSFPSYAHDSHPSGAAADVVRNSDGWRSAVYHQGDTYQGMPHKTPQEAANEASSIMDDLGNGQ
jgi:hypothetical protein